MQFMLNHQLCLQMRCLMQTFLKLASNPKTFVSESQFSSCVNYFQLVNTSHTERTITIALPSVGCTEHYLKYRIAGTGLQCLWCCRQKLVTPAVTLLSGVTTATLTNESVLFVYLIAVLRVTPTETSWRP